MKLSYTTINTCLQPTNSHNWLNRQMGRNIPENPAFETGKRIHRIIQSDLSKFKIVHPNNYLVERQDRDDLTYFEFPLEGYTIIGYLDGYSETDKSILEIKSGTKFWSIMDFVKSPQIGIYALAHSNFTYAICITALSDELLWQIQPPKVYEVELTAKMRKDAKKYILDAISLFEKGDFTGGLTDGKCIGWCNYGQNCFFK